MHKMSITVMVAALGLVAGGCNAPGATVQATRDFALVAPWEGYDQVVVRSHNGAVDLYAAEVSEIHIDGTLHVRGVTQAEAEANLDKLQVLAEADADDPKTFRIELKLPEALKRKSPGASFVIKVPQACAAHVDTSNGAVYVERMKESVVVDTSNGAVQVANVHGSVRADTSNGSVEITEVDGDVRVDTSNGGVVLRKVTGKCVVDTSNGSVEVEDVGADVRVDTSNAGIRVGAVPAKLGQLILDTSNGSINLTLPTALAADLVLDTSNGRIKVDFADIPAEVRRRSRTRVEATINGGGGKVVADTSNASITVRFRD